jgi:Ni/Fe-hydrogenase subunit HybB-like protein
MKRWIGPALLVLVGLMAAVQHVAQGESATAMGSIGAGGAVWGLYVVADGFLVGASLSALVLACLLRLLRRRTWEDAATVATTVSSIGLTLSALCVLADSGRPWQALTVLPVVGRARSPFFGTFTIAVGACLIASLLQTLLAVRAQAGLWGWRNTPGERLRRQRSAFGLALFTLPLALSGLWIMARVFASRPGRPPSNVMLEMVTFVALAAASGLALWVCALAAAGRMTAGRSLARALLVTVALGLPLVVACEHAALRSVWPAVRRYGLALQSGDWRVLFWGQIGLLFAVGATAWAQLWRRRLLWRWLVLWSCAVLAAVFVHHFLVLVAWQTHGLGLPYPAGRYRPTWGEVALTVGVFGLGALLFLSSLRLLSRRQTLAADSEPATASALRHPVTWVSIAVGALLAMAGLALSAQWGVERFSDPLVPGSPLLFLAGLVVMAAATLPYELLRDRPSTAAQDTESEAQSARS